MKQVNALRLRRMDAGTAVKVTEGGKVRDCTLVQYGKHKRLKVRDNVFQVISDKPGRVYMVNE